ncbi:THO complex subunit 4 [Apostichopus japonicus]|uniref:THO complex subunit 4 n=1 Tax=Stichopus japonicus TaxID=307972 RepID=A0A2G8L1K4_STIJA|nr:THO complex subunit 4 [Apostichopus japonicus]
MGDKIDQSLDDIIKQDRAGKRGRGRGRGGRGRGGGNRGGGFQTRNRGGRGGGGPVRRGRGSSRGRQTPYSRFVTMKVTMVVCSILSNKPDALALLKVTIHPQSSLTSGNMICIMTAKLEEEVLSVEVRGGGGGQLLQGKLLVSNLDFGVSDADIQELFTDFGELVKAAVHYDRSGRSLGTADVVFRRKADAIKAMKQYHKVPLDGRAMDIQLATSAVEVSQPQRTQTFNRPRGQSQNFRRGGQTRGARAAAVSGGVLEEEEEEGAVGVAEDVDETTVQHPTAEELDAELDEYNAQVADTMFVTDYSGACLY